MRRPDDLDRLPLPTPADLDAIAVDELPALIAQLAALQSAAAMRLRRARRR